MNTLLPLDNGLQEVDQLLDRSVWRWELELIIFVGFFPIIVYGHCSKIFYDSVILPVAPRLQSCYLKKTFSII